MKNKFIKFVVVFFTVLSLNVCSINETSIQNVQAMQQIENINQYQLNGYLLSETIDEEILIDDEGNLLIHSIFLICIVSNIAFIYQLMMKIIKKIK